MKHTLTARGFKHLEPIPDSRGGEIRLYESSAAYEPCVWLSIRQADGAKIMEARAHLTLDQARVLRKQLKWLIENHYQWDDSDTGAEA